MAACSRAHLSQPVREKDGRRANGPTREGGLPSPFVRNRWRCISFPPCFFLSSFLCKCFPDAKSAPGRAWPMRCKGETLFFHWFNTNTSRSNIFLCLHLSPDMFLLLFSLSLSFCLYFLWGSSDISWDPSHSGIVRSEFRGQVCNPPRQQMDLDLREISFLWGLCLQRINISSFDVLLQHDTREQSWGKETDKMTTSLIDMSRYNSMTRSTVMSL